MRTRLRPIIRDYSFARSRRYLRVQCEPLGLLFIARFYPADFPTVAAARAAARHLCDRVEPILRTAYAETKRDPRRYIGKNGPKKSSALPPGLSYQPAAFPHTHIVVRWSASGCQVVERFRLRHGHYPAIIRAARQLRSAKVRAERLRVKELAAACRERLRAAFLEARTAGAHVIMEPSRKAQPNTSGPDS